VGFRIASVNSGTELPSLSRSTYVVSAPIIAYYYTQIIGDAKKPPTLLASSKFNGIAVIGQPFFIGGGLHHLMNCLVDADPYLSNGAQWYINQNNMQVIVVITTLSAV
jgi:hypothetical protein